MYRVWLKQTMWFRRRQTFEKGQDRQPDWRPFKGNRLKKNLTAIILMKKLKLSLLVASLLQRDQRLQFHVSLISSTQLKNFFFAISKFMVS